MNDSINNGAAAEDLGPGRRSYVSRLLLPDEKIVYAADVSMEVRRRATAVFWLLGWTLIGLLIWFGLRRDTRESEFVLTNRRAIWAAPSFGWTVNNWPLAEIEGVEALQIYRKDESRNDAPRIGKILLYFANGMTSRVRMSDPWTFVERFEAAKAAVQAEPEEGYPTEPLPGRYPTEGRKAFTESTMEPGERIIFVADIASHYRFLALLMLLFAWTGIGALFFVTFLWAASRNELVLTNRRLVVNQGWLLSKTRQFDLRRISDITWRINPKNPSGGAEIFAYGQYWCSLPSLKEPEQFRHALLAAIAATGHDPETFDASYDVELAPNLEEPRAYTESTLRPGERIIYQGNVAVSTRRTITTAAVCTFWIYGLGFLLYLYGVRAGRRMELALTTRRVVYRNHNFATYEAPLNKIANVRVARLNERQDTGRVHIIGSGFSPILTWPIDEPGRFVRQTELAIERLKAGNA